MIVFSHRVVESSLFQRFILLVIGVNALVMGLQTSSWVQARAGCTLKLVDQICLGIFVVELLLKIIAYNRRFLYDRWNIFDFLVVAVCFVPSMGALSTARVFRVLRVFKVVSSVRPLRMIIGALLKSVPGMLWTIFLLGLIYYVYAIIGTTLFGARFIDWFGSLGRSFYSLFQIMTLESWSMGIARPVIAEFPYAWIYFVSFVLISSFIVMNIVVAIVVNSMGDIGKADKAEREVGAAGDLEAEIRKLEEQLEVVKQIAAKRSVRP